MLYSFTVLGLVDGAGILSELPVQFQETHAAGQSKRVFQGTGDPALCTIYVQKLTGQKLTLKARPGDTILSLKQKIRDTEGIPLANQRLVFKGRELFDGRKLYESNIFDGAYVDLQSRN